MFGRFEQSDMGKALPSEWQESFVKALTETYFDQSEKDQCFFDVYGQIYDKEFVVIVSYIHHTDQLKAPITISISHDLIDDSKRLKKALSEIADLAGLILDDIFATNDWSDYVPNWTENKYKEHTFHYKITRENIGLTLQAEQLLAGNLDD